MKHKGEWVPKKAEQYQKILETLQEGYLLVDKQGHVCETNAAYCKMMGYTREELHDMNLTNLRTDVSSQELLDVLSGIADGDSKHFESRHRKKDGTILDLNVSAAGIEKDNKILIAGLVWDITEEKKARQKREESEQRFKSLFEHNPHPVYYFDLEGNFKEVNQKLVEFTGCRREELLQMGFAHFVDEKDLEETQKHFQQATKGISGEYEISVWVQDDVKKDVRVTKFPMYVNEKIVGVYGILQDVTEQKQTQQQLKKSEERWYRLVEKSPQCLVISVDNIISYINIEGAKILGHGKPEEIEGRSLFDFAHPDDWETIKTRIPKMTQETLPPSEQKIIDLDGTVKNVLAYSVFISYRGEDAVQSVLYDITKQKRTAQKLKESEEKWHQLVRKSPLPVQVSKDGIILYINKAGADLYGAENYKELIGESIFSFNTPEMQQKIKERVKRMNKDLAVDSFHQHKIINKKGEERFVEVHSLSIDYQGERAIQSIYRDITDQKVAEQKLKESEDRWYKIVEGNPKPVQIIVDADIVFINKAGVDLYEAESRDELMGKSVLDFSHPGDLEMVKQRKAKLEKGLPVEQMHENRLITLKGNQRVVDVHSVPITYKGQQAIQTVLYDITEQKKARDKIKESENLKSAILETAIDAIVTIDHDGNILEFNKAAERMFGYKQEEIGGKEMGEVIVPAHYRQEHKEGMDRYLKTGESEIMGKRVQMEAMRADGSIFPIELTVNKIEGTEPAKFTGFLRDITERLHKENEVLESLEEKKIMLQEIHHRVKNNMAVISGLLELQSLSTDDKSVQEILQKSQMRIYSMAMIHEKLYASESLAEISFDEYAKELVKVIKNSIGDINNEVTVRYRMDPVQLNVNQAIPCALILNELIVNCYKHAFNDDKTGTILVTFTKKGTEITLSVEDNGRGLPDNFNIEEQQSLGMTIIQTLTKQLEADLKINNRENHPGTCFIISFSEND